jgi:hypothetical protein
MNCVYGWCVERIEYDKREEWEAQLTAELPGREKAKPTEQQIEQEGADFMAAMMAHQQRASV